MVSHTSSVFLYTHCTRDIGIEKGHWHREEIAVKISTLDPLYTYTCSCITVVRNYHAGQIYRVNWVQQCIRNLYMCGIYHTLLFRTRHTVEVRR